jgi:hypothetical protein
MLKNDSGGNSTTFESRRDLWTNATPITKTIPSSVSPEHQQVSVAHFSELFFEIVPRSSPLCGDSLVFCILTSSQCDQAVTSWLYDSNVVCSPCCNSPLHSENEKLSDIQITPKYR